jgi:hypothetical protein
MIVSKSYTSTSRPTRPNHQPSHRSLGSRRNQLLPAGCRWPAQILKIEMLFFEFRMCALSHKSVVGTPDSKPQTSPKRLRSKSSNWEQVGNNVGTERRTNRRRTAWKTVEQREAKSMKGKERRLVCSAHNRKDPVCDLDSWHFGSYPENFLENFFRTCLGG